MKKSGFKLIKTYVNLFTHISINVINICVLTIIAVIILY